MTLVEATAAPAAPGVAGVRAAPPDTGAARFLGRERTYWRLLARGAVLLMFTLGIYRFWLSTDMRRFLWANTEIAGDGLEYIGTARELLIGFLIAIVTLTPIYAALFFAGLAVLGPWSAVIGFVLLAWFGHFAVFRARRYRLTRTVFRGLRFHQTGSATRYASRVLLWWIMIALTLGLAYPWAQASLERYKMRNTFYGDLKGDFAGSGVRLFVLGILMWLIVLGPLLAALALAGIVVDWAGLVRAVANPGGNLMARIETASPDFAEAIVYLVSASIWAVAAAALLYPAFQAMLLRWWMSGLRFGNVTAASRLRTSQVYGIYLRFLGHAVAFAIVMGIAGAIGYGVFYSTLGAAEQSELAEVVGILASVVGYVVVMLGYSTIYQVTVKLRLWRAAFESVELSGIRALDRVRARGAASSPYGEGLADALNVGGI